MSAARRMKSHPTGKAKPRKRLTAAARRESILCAAKILFYTEGYGSVSMDQIAAAAGISKPVVYDHFASKQALYVEIMQRIQQFMLTDIVHSLSADASLESRFRQGVHGFFTLMRSDPTIPELFFIQPRAYPELLAEWQRFEAAAAASLAPLVKAILPDLRPFEAKVAIRLIHHGLASIPDIWSRSVSVDAMTETVFRFFWSGLSGFDTSKRRR